MYTVRWGSPGPSISSGMPSHSGTKRADEKMIATAPGKRLSPASLALVTLSVLAICTLLGLFALAG